MRDLTDEEEVQLAGLCRAEAIAQAYCPKCKVMTGPPVDRLQQCCPACKTVQDRVPLIAAKVVRASSDVLCREAIDAYGEHTTNTHPTCPDCAAVWATGSDAIDMAKFGCMIRVHLWREMIRVVLGDRVLALVKTGRPTAG